MAIEHYRKGDDLLHDRTFHLITIAPLTSIHGWFGPRDALQADEHNWTVDVYARFSPKVAAAYASATDGFQADLNEEPEFLGLGERSYMFARFERKHFHWGHGVSFLSQFSQDPVFYVPHNGHLRYEVWGITPDQKYTIVAHLAVSHPKLGKWGPRVRHVSSIKALKNDRDYKLVETCEADQFQPSLTAFDKMLDTLVVR